MAASQSKKQPASKQRNPKDNPRDEDLSKESRTAEQGNAEPTHSAVQGGVDADSKENENVSAVFEVPVGYSGATENDEEPEYMSVYGHNGRFEPEQTSGFQKWVFKMESGPNIEQLEDACKEGTDQRYAFERLFGAPIQRGLCEAVAGSVIERLMWEVKLLPVKPDDTEVPI